MSYIFSADTEFFAVRPDFVAVTPIPFPLDVFALIGRYPSGGILGRRRYVVGQHTANLMIDEAHRCVRVSIPHPSDVPTVAVVGGTTPQICYTRFYDEITDERGPLSEGLVVAAGGTTRTWTLLPTVVPGDSVVVDGTATIVAGAVSGSSAARFTRLRPGDRIAISTDLTRWARIRTITSDSAMTIDDTAMAGVAVALVAKAVSRVSHVELWVAVNGALPRMSVRVRLGTTTVIESTATLALGVAEVTSFTAMPFGSHAVTYNQRLLIAGVAGHEDTVYLSLIGLPERYSGLSFKTEYGEPIVGMFRHRKYVVLLCPDSSYVLQGVADEDFVLDGLEEDIGGFGPFVAAEGIAYVAGRKGILAFNGAFHQAIPTRRTEWTEKHRANPAMFENGFFAINPNDGTVQFFLNQRLGTTLDTACVWVGQYEGVGPSGAGSLLAPEWFADHQTPISGGGIVTCAVYLSPAGARSGAFFFGTSTGIVYEEVTDNTQPYTGAVARVVSRWDMFIPDPGGDVAEGRELIRPWSYVMSEQSAWELRIWPGEEFCWPVVTSGIANPVYDDNVAASLVSLRGPLVTHVHPVANIDGRGWVFEYRFTSPLDVWFIGFGVVVSAQGVVTRPAKFAELPT